MRSEKEMMDLIINTAKDDVRIRAVILNGSRANEFVQKDKYQDFDIVYLVSDFQFFVDNHNWIDIFGERIMFEMPAYKDFDPSEYDGQFNYQMLFTDGNRIDLTFASVDQLKAVIDGDKMGCILLDKDSLLSDLYYDNGEMYFVKKPSSKDFENKCNCFWWILQNVAKGIKRKELPYAMAMLNYAREYLEEMISWYVGMNTNYTISTGKHGKYLEKNLENKTWQEYLSTFPTGNYDSIWNAMFSACSLFRKIAIAISKCYLYEYPFDDDKRMTKYLKNLQINEAERKDNNGLH